MYVPRLKCSLICVLRKGDGDIVFSVDTISVDIGMTLSFVQDISRTSGWLQHLGMMKTFLVLVTFP